MLFSFEFLRFLLQWASTSLTNSAYVASFGLRAFLVSSLKLIPKFKSVFVFASCFRWTMWRFTSFGCNSLFIPLINVSAIFAGCFRWTWWWHFVAKVFRVGYSENFFMQAVFINANPL